MKTPKLQDKVTIKVQGEETEGIVSKLGCSVFEVYTKKGTFTFFYTGKPLFKDEGIQMIQTPKNEEYDKWVKELNNLDQRINNLKVWDDYAEYLQREYDYLIKQNPKEQK